MIPFKVQEKDGYIYYVAYSYKGYCQKCMSFTGFVSVTITDKNSICFTCNSLPPKNDDHTYREYYLYRVCA